MSLSTVPPSPGLRLGSDLQRQAFVDTFGQTYGEHFQDPVLFMEVTLCAPPVLKAYRRDFRLVSRMLFAETLYRRRPDFDVTLLDHFHEQCQARLAEVQRVLEAHIAQVCWLCGQSAAGADAAYLSSHTVTVPVIHAGALAYLRCLEGLDQLLLATGSAALCGVLSPAQRKSCELSGRRALQGFGTLIRQQHQRLKLEALRLHALHHDAPDLQAAARLVDAAWMDEGGSGLPASTGAHGTHGTQGGGLGAEASGRALQ